jgi:hypothetical protein
MTERATVQMMREEVDPADLQKLPHIERHRDGYSFNTSKAENATFAINVKQAGHDYRVEVHATTNDGERYPVFLNEGHSNGIGVDGLKELLSREGMSLPEAVEKYTFGAVPKDEIAFYQLEFYEEHHR